MLLYSVYGGAQLYDLTTSTSDIDVRGVFIEPPHLFFSLDTMDYYEDTVSDTVLFSLRKFIHLALKNNPNSLELLFAPPSKWIMHTPQWLDIYNIRHKFLSQRAIKAYTGYLYSEYDQWKKAYDYYPLDEKKLNKRASHIYRLAYNLVQLKSIQSFSPTLYGEERNDALAIKEGTLSRLQVERLIELELDYIAMLNPTGRLPLEPDYTYINRLITNIQQRALCENLN
jgi:uncharacterized protein